MITEQDIMENILQPEFESALFAAIQNSEVKRDKDGIVRITVAARDSLRMPNLLLLLDEMQHRADEFVAEIFGEER